MDWNELEEKLQELQRPVPEKQQHVLQQRRQQITCQLAELSLAGNGSIEELLDWLDNIDESKKGTDVHRYALRTLGDIIDIGQGKFVRDSLEDIFRHLREAVETLSKQSAKSDLSPGLGNARNEPAESTNA